MPTRSATARPASANSDRQRPSAKNTPVATRAATTTSLSAVGLQRDDCQGRKEQCSEARAALTKTEPACDSVDRDQRCDESAELDEADPANGSGEQHRPALKISALGGYSSIGPYVASGTNPTEPRWIRTPPVPGGRSARRTPSAA